MNLQSRARVLITAVVCLASITSKAQVEIPKLIKYSSSECEEFHFGNRRNIQNRILSHTIIGDSQVYNVFVATNCDRTAKGEIKFVNDTLKLRYHNFIKVSEDIIKVNDSVSEMTEIHIEEVVECDCAYELRYEISGLKAQPKVVTLNDEIIIKTKHKYKVRHKAPRFDIVNNDTINCIDVYGLKQKYHLTYRPDGRLLTKMFFKDNQQMSGLSLVKYDNNGFERIELYKENGNYYKRKYYKNKKLVKVCDSQGAFDDNTNCILFK